MDSYELFGNLLMVANLPDSAQIFHSSFVVLSLHQYTIFNKILLQYVSYYMRSMNFICIIDSSNSSHGDSVTTLLKTLVDHFSDSGNKISMQLIYV